MHLFIDCDNNIKCLSFIQEGPVQKAPHFHSPEPVYALLLGYAFFVGGVDFATNI